MKLIEINKNKIYKSKNENIYYKKMGDEIFRSCFYSDWDNCRVVTNIEELTSIVLDMDSTTWSTRYDASNKELEISIRQANMFIHLDSFKVQKLLEDINEVMEAPF